MNGNYNQESGSTYITHVTPGTDSSDQIAVTGAATIASGATLDVIKTVAGSYTPGSVYTVLSAGGGVSGSSTGGTLFQHQGEFDLTALYGLEEIDNANTVQLVVVQNATTSDMAQTANERGVAKAVDSIVPAQAGTTTLATAIGSEATATGVREALNQSSGEIHASIKAAMLDDSRFSRDAAFDRLNDAFCSIGPNAPRRISQQTRNRAAGDCIPDPRRLSFWGGAFGGWGHYDGNGNAARMGQSIGGFLFGADTRVGEHWRIGAMAGFSRSNFDVSERMSSGSSSDVYAGVYGGRQWGRLGLKLGATYTYHDISTRRSVMAPGFSASPRGRYDANGEQGFGELSYRLNAGPVVISPFANAAYVNLRTSGFRESGGEAALTGHAGNTDGVFTTVGFHSFTDFRIGRMAVRAQGTLGWRRTSGMRTPKQKLDLSTGNGDDTGFAVWGVPLAADSVVVRAGLAMQAAPGVTVGLSYGGMFSTANSYQGVTGNVRVNF